MEKIRFQVGDIVRALPYSNTQYSITSYRRGFIGIVLDASTNPQGEQNSITVLDLFACEYNPFVRSADYFFTSKFEEYKDTIALFKHALSCPSTPYTGNVPFEILSSASFSFSVHPKYFEKMNHVPYTHWKQYVAGCIAPPAGMQGAELVNRQRLSANIEDHFDMFITQVSKYLNNMEPIFVPKLSL